MPSAKVTFRDGRTATVSGTEEQIRAAIDAYNSRSDVGTQAQIAQEPAAPEGPGQQQFDDSGEVIGTSRGRADQAVQLSERDEARINQLQELARTDPNQRDSVNAQIESIRNRAMGTQKNVFQQAAPIADVAGAVASAAWREPVSGLMGLYRFAATRGSFQERMDAAAGQVRDFQEGGAQIDSEEGQAFMATVTKPLQWMDQGLKDFSGVAGGVVANVAGEQAGVAVSTALYTAGMMAPEIFGIKGAAARRTRDLVTRDPVTGRVTSRTPAPRPTPDGRPEAPDVEMSPRERARRRIERGVVGDTEYDAAGNLVRKTDGNLELSPVAWRGRLNERAQSMAGRPGRGRNVQSAVESLQNQRAIDEMNMQAAWTNAEEVGQLRYYTGNIEGWAIGARRALINEGKDLRVMPKVSQFLDDMEAVGRINPLDQSERAITAQHGLPQNLADIREMEAMNARLNQYIRQSDGPEYAMLSRLKEELNTSIDSQIDRGLMSGDPAVHAAYKNAREISAQYYERYNSDRTISRLAHMEADATQVRNWLLGASDALPPASIHQLLDRISELPNGQQLLDGVKMEVQRGLMEPLLKPNVDLPDYNRFVDNVHRFKERYPDVFERMDFDLTALDDLAKFTSTFSKHGGSGIFAGLKPSSLIARFWVGHGIARKAAKVNLFARGLSALGGTLFGRSSRLMWDDLMRQMTDGVVKGHQSPLFDLENMGIAGIVTSDQLQSMGVSPEDAREWGPRAVAEVPEIQARMMDHNEATQTNPNVPVDNRYNPGDGYDVMADAKRFADTGVKGQSIAADLMVQENSDEVHNWKGMVHPDPVHGDAVPTIGFGTNLTKLPKDHMERMGWTDADIMAMIRGDKGISQEEGIKLMAMRLVDNEKELRNTYDSWYPNAPANVKRALRNASYTMGTGFLRTKFPKMRAALENEDYEEAARQLLTGKDGVHASDYLHDVKETRARFVAAELMGVRPDQVKLPPPQPGREY